MTDSKPDWIFCFDSDERPEIDLTGIDLTKYDGIRLRLFDFYITPEDVDLSWRERRWIGPEYRDILMMFRAAAVKGFCDREPALFENRILFSGFVKHYGKAISVEDWERKCTYYGEHLPEPYQTKWRNRKGKAVKRDFKSDFGLPLIKWEERIAKGIRLTGRIHQNETH